MKREFDSASRTPAPDIATKAELDQRLANRPTPASPHPERGEDG